MKGIKKIMMEMVGSVIIFCILIGGFMELFHLSVKEYLSWKDGDEE